MMVIGNWYRIANSDYSIRLLDPALGNGLGNYSITLGDSDTGIKWVSDGKYEFWSDYQVIARIEQQSLTLNKNILKCARFRANRSIINNKSG